MDNPSVYGLEYEDVVLRTKDGVKITGYLMLQQQQQQQHSTAPTVIIFHANAGNMVFSPSLQHLKERELMERA